MHRTRPRAAVIALLLLMSGTALALPQQQGSVNLLNQAQFQWEGPGEAQGGSQTGGSIAGLGDIFHTGQSAVAIGAPEAQPEGRLGAGSVYVVRGQSRFGAADLTALAGRGYRIDGAQAGDGLGFALAALRLRGGHPGLAIGAPYAAPFGRSQAGITYVIDLSRLRGDLDLASPHPGAALVGVITGGAACAKSGYALADAGPARPATAEDLLIGAPGADPHGCPSDTAGGVSGGNTGAAYLVSGAQGVARHLDLATPGRAASTYLGAAAGDRVGAAVSAAGAAGSFMVGAPDASPLGRPGAGQVYLIRGAAPGARYSVGALPRGSTTFDGAAFDDALGSALAATTGFVSGSAPATPELVMGAPQGSPRRRGHAGAVFIVRESAEPAVVDLAHVKARGFPGGQIDGAGAGDEAGSALTAVGDVNGDGRPDIAIGAPYVNSQTGQNRIDNGAAYILFGGRGGATLDLAQLPARGYVAYGARDDDEAGTALAGGVDVNGDGRPDVLIGAPFAENTLESTPQEGGAAYLIIGTGRPQLRYPSTTITARVGRRLTLRAITSRTGPASFSVSPSLPRGLSLNRTSGLISGTPRSTRPPGLYAVQLSDAAGSAEVTLTISVQR